MQPWFKLWPERLLTPAVFALSPAARSTYLWAFVLASQAREKGFAMVVADLAVLTGLPASRQLLVLREVSARGLIELDGEVIRLPAFDEMQRPRSGSERMKALRERDAGVTELPYARDGESDDGVTKKIEIPLRTPFTSFTPYSGGSAAQNGTAAPVAWAEKIRAESDALGDLDLAALTPAQRFVVARRHALEFANCTRSEGQNAARARSIAAGIASLTDRLNKDRVDVSVRDYLAGARALWRRGDEMPLFKAFDVYGELVDSKP